MLPIAKGRLIALRAPSTHDPKADPPARLVMLNWGENKTTKGPVVVDKVTLSSFAANQARLGFDEVVLDFEHNTVPGHPSNKGEPALIAARFKPSIIEGEGMVFDAGNWTGAGKDYREHYHDLSPAVQLDDENRVIFCHSGALCRNGAVYDLHAFDAGYNFETLSVVRFSATPSGKPNDPAVIVQRNAVDLDLLRKILNLSSTATYEDINRALAAFEGTDDVGTGLSADIIASVRALNSKVSGFESRFEDNERVGIVNLALSAGKVIPKEFLEGEHRMNNAQLKVLVAGLPSIVPLEMRTPEKLKDFAAVAANSVDEEVRRNMGISEDTWKKHNKAQTAVTV